MTVIPEIPFSVITSKDVRASIKRAKRSLEDAATEIVWQIEMEGWRTLGYTSWNAMREAEYGDAAFMVPRKDRPELVGRMRRAGLTQQEIADTAGVNAATVSRDLANASSEDPLPAITNARGQERPATYAKAEPSGFCRQCGADPCACLPPNATTAPMSVEAVITVTCPTCHGTGKVTQ